MVSVEVPEPLAIEAGTNAHAGVGVTEGAIVQDRFTVRLKPLSGAMAIVATADPPAEIEVGESAVAAIVKSGVTGALTVRLIDVVWLTDPEVPVTVMLKVA